MRISHLFLIKTTIPVDACFSKVKVQKWKESILNTNKRKEYQQEDHKINLNENAMCVICLSNMYKYLQFYCSCKLNLSHFVPLILIL